MYRPSDIWSFDYYIFAIACVLVVISIGVLRAIAPFLFPTYFLYVGVALIAYVLFVRVNFVVLVSFYKHLYGLSVFLLILPLIIGEITRGAVRWIPLGPIAVQPSELVRPFLVIFLATFLTSEELTVKRIFQAGILLALPVFLILVQPSLGVATLTSVAFTGVFLASTLNKKHILAALMCVVASIPLIWLLLAPYQKERITTFLNPNADPLGAGYNSIQSMISVGSGQLLGRGLGKGVQTQLSFLPERHTDFVFASIAEETGLVGVVFVLLFLFLLLWRMTKIMEMAKSPTARAYVSGISLVMLFQIIFNIGMNMGVFPITGIPLPLVSAGGSSLIATMMALGIVSNARRERA